MSWTQGTTLTSDRVEWKDSATNTADNTNQPYSLGTEYHIAMVLKPVGNSTQVTWYVAPATSNSLGAARGTFTSTNSLTNFIDSADNLGRSFYGDNTASASYDEVRMWNAALDSDRASKRFTPPAPMQISARWVSAPFAGQLPSTTAVNITASGAALDLNSINQTIGSLTGVTGSQVLLGSGTLTTGGDNTSTTFAGTIFGGGSLVKQGAGTFTLTGTNSTISQTTVNAGTLIVNGALNGNVTVNSGAILGGSGTINGINTQVTINSGGILAPGNSPGLITVASLKLNAGSQTQIELGGIDRRHAVRRHQRRRHHVSRRLAERLADQQLLPCPRQQLRHPQLDQTKRPLQQLNSPRPFHRPRLEHHQTLHRRLPLSHRQQLPPRRPRSRRPRHQRRSSRPLKRPGRPDRLSIHPRPRRQRTHRSATPPNRRPHRRRHNHQRRHPRPDLLSHQQRRLRRQLADAGPRTQHARTGRNREPRGHHNSTSTADNCREAKGELTMHSLRRAILWALASVFLTLSIATLVLANPSDSTYRLVFADEFDGTTLDTSKWSAASPGWTMPNSASTASAGQVAVGNGILTLNAVRTGASTFTSGSVSSYTKYNFTGGYVEARIDLPSTLGSWPAFWGLYTGWPPEADIMEYPITTDGGTSGLANNKYNTSFHYTNSQRQRRGRGRRGNRRKQFGNQRLPHVRHGLDDGHQRQVLPRRHSGPVLHQFGRRADVVHVHDSGLRRRRLAGHAHDNPMAARFQRSNQSRLGPRLAKKPEQRRGFDLECQRRRLVYHRRKLDRRRRAQLRQSTGRVWPRRRGIDRIDHDGLLASHGKHHVQRRCHRNHCLHRRQFIESLAALQHRRRHSLPRPLPAPFRKRSAQTSNCRATPRFATT